MENIYSVEHKYIVPTETIEEAEKLAELFNESFKKSLCDVFINSRKLTGNLYTKDDGLIHCNLEELYGRNVMPYIPLHGSYTVKPIMEGVTSENAKTTLYERLNACFEHNLINVLGGDHDVKVHNASTD